MVFESPKKYSLMANSRVCCMYRSSLSTHPPDLSSFTIVIASPLSDLTEENRRIVSLCKRSDPRTRITFTGSVYLVNDHDK